MQNNGGRLVYGGSVVTESNTLPSDDDLGKELELVACSEPTTTPMTVHVPKKRYGVQNDFVTV